jgi:hypothetical protein
MVSGTELRLESKPLTGQLVLIQLLAFARSTEGFHQQRLDRATRWRQFLQESEPGTEPPPGIDRESG